MVLTHRCERCGFDSRNKSDVLRHLRKQKPCAATSAEADIPRKDLIQCLDQQTRPPVSTVCPGCKVQFATLYSMRRHVDSRRCPGLLEQAIQGQKDLQEQLQRLQERLEVLEQRPPPLSGQNNTNCNNTNCNNTNTYNITINNFNKEDTSYLTPELLFERLLRMEDGVLRTVEDIHFNPDHPENQNVRIRSIKRGHLEVRKNNEWQIVPADDIVARMVFVASTLVCHPARYNPDFKDKLEQEHEDALAWHQKLNSKDPDKSYETNKTRRDVLERTRLLVINKTRPKPPPISA
jgi:hypothetical protein